MKENETSTRFSNNYTNEEIAISIGKIARENFAIKHPTTNKPKEISRRYLVSLLNEKHENLNLADTLEINELVKLSYEINSSIVREAIVETIKENLGNDSVYNPKRIYPSNQVSQFSNKEKDDLTAKFNLLKSNAAEVDNEASKTKIDRVLETTRELKFKKEFLGIGNADSAKKYAKDVLSGYESMIGEYDKIKNINLNLVNDFLILRDELKSEREDVLQLLIDLIGERAKQQFPDLFDFSQIEWLDFEESWEKLTLSYNQINEKHEEFLSVVDAAIDDFGNSISTESSKAWNNLSTTSKKRDLDQGDLVGAGVQVAFSAGAAAIKGVINTRNKSKEVVAIIQRDVEILKQEMSKDNEIILADIFRLGEIYSKISHSFLPNYSVFIQKNSDIIGSELRPLYDKIIQNPIIHKAKEENNTLIKRQRFLKQKILDFEKNIEYSKKEEIRLGEILEFKKHEYQIAKSLEPKKPFILIDLFTFGRAAKIFEATMREWITFCKPVIDDYHYIREQQDDEINKRNLITESISECEKELSSLNQNIKSNSEIIKTEFNKDPISQDELVKLITVIKKIINTSREVLEVSLDQELYKKTVI